MSRHVPPTPEPPEDGGRIVDEALSEALSRRYLAYALSTIMNRALPDARDGLKPVHRRLLHSMRQMGLAPQTSAKKCARVVGDVIGRFHPHGDQSVYEALVRLAQDFAQRYPLIDGQGNFGNIDGDNPAAMRYTECKLTPAAQLLLDGIDEDAVDFRATYDGEDHEPVVLPAAFPNLLANGASGIAVGMATSIPPHNAGELIDACLLLLQRPEATTADLMERVPAPDFPTGGVIVESAASRLETYETGRGGVRVRARWVREDAGRGAYRIVVTQMPFQVQKARLVEQLAALIEQKKAPFLADVRDESAEEIRLVIEPRARTIEADALMEGLYRLCDLEVRFPVNMNVLDRTGTPRVMGLKPLLRAFLDHRREIDQRRARHRRARIEARLHILDGLLVVYLDLDEVIRIVRFEDEPKARLIDRFTLSDLQAEAILNTRLRALARLEEMEIRREHAALTKERDGLSALLDSEKRQWAKVAADLRKVRDTLAKPPLGVRRTEIGEAPAIDAPTSSESLVPREPITVILSERGWIRAARGAVADPSELKFKEGDGLAFLVPAETADRLLILASDGRIFTLGCDRLPSGRGQGEPLRLMLDVEDGVKIIALFPHRAGARRLLASGAGYGFVMSEDEALANRRAGKQVLNLGDDAGAEAKLCLPVEGDQLAVIGDNGKILVLPLAELPEMGRGRGVRLQGYREGGLRDAMTFSAEAGPSWTDAAGRRRDWPAWRDWQGRRGGAGKLAPKGFPANRRFRPG